MYSLALVSDSGVAHIGKIQCCVNYKIIFLLNVNSLRLDQIFIDIDDPWAF